MLLSEKLSAKLEVFTVKNCRAFLFLPPEIETCNSIPWVWYAPTLPCLPAIEERWMFDKFLNAGIAVAGIDVGESYGSPSGTKILNSFYEELVSRRSLSEKPCLLARSRGGLQLYNWAIEHKTLVTCIAGIYPVCNLASYPGLKKACGAYGLSEKQLGESLCEYNPVERINGLAEAGIPIYHLHGDCDTAVPLEENSGLLAERYKKAGGAAMTLEVVKGQGHNMWSGWFQSPELVDFIISHALAGE